MTYCSEGRKEPEGRRMAPANVAKVHIYGVRQARIDVVHSVSYTVAKVDSSDHFWHELAKPIFVIYDRCGRERARFDSVLDGGRQPRVACAQT